MGFEIELSTWPGRRCRLDVVQRNGVCAALLVRDRVRQLQERGLTVFAPWRAAVGKLQLLKFIEDHLIII